MTIVPNFVSMQRQAQGRRFRVRPPPRSNFPGSVERAYRRYLLSLVNAVKADVDELLVPLIPALVRVATGRADAARYNIEDIEGTLRTTTEDINLRLNNTHLRGLEEKVGEYQSATSQRVTHDLRRQIRSMISLDAFPQAGTAERIQSEAHLTENVKLIKSLTGDYVDQVENMVRRGVRSGDRAKTIEDKVLKRWSVARSRAKLIARDQIAKLRGNLTRIRQESLGVDRYKWRTSRDERVRATHAAKEGKVFSWDDAPSDTGHPGQDYQCRCTAEPFIEAVLPQEAEQSERFSLVPPLAAIAVGGAAGTALGGAAGAAGFALGSATAAGAATVSAAPLVPAAAWLFPGPPWPVSAATPNAPFSADRLAGIVGRVDWLKPLPESAQAAIRRELNALIAAQGLTNQALRRGLSSPAALRSKNLIGAGIAGMYNARTGEIEMDSELADLLAQAVKQGVPAEINPVFGVMVHETVHSTGPLTVPYREMTGIRRLVEELSTQHYTEVMLYNRFGTRQGLWEDKQSAYHDWAVGTRDAIRRAFELVPTGLDRTPTTAEVQRSLSEFLLGIRYVDEFASDRAMRAAFAEGFFPDRFFPGMKPRQVRKLRRQLMKQWKAIMSSEGLGDF